MRKGTCIKQFIIQATAERTSDDDRGMYNFCKKQYKSIRSFYRHLHYKHQEEIDQKIFTDIRRYFKTNERENYITTLGSARTIPDAQITLIQCLSSCGLILNLFNHSSFKEFIRIINPQYVVPKSHILRPQNA